MRRKRTGFLIGFWRWRSLKRGCGLKARTLALVESEILGQSLFDLQKPAAASAINDLFSLDVGI